MKKFFIIFSVVILLLIMSSCGQKLDGDGMVYEEPKKSEEASETSESADTIDLTVVPEDCELVPFERFKEGFALISNTEWDAGPATMEELTRTFGTEGIHYSNCDTIQDGIQYRAYAWFSDEEYIGDMQVAVGIIFKEDKETSRLTYYSYGAQGIDYTDIE